VRIPLNHAALAAFPKLRVVSSSLIARFVESPAQAGFLFASKRWLLRVC
jgi:hypothetical protein